VKRIVILGAGFAGLVSAIGAARKLAELNIPREDVSVTIVNRDEWHAIRVRNYENDLSDVRVPLADVLEPIGVDLIVGDVTAIDCARREVGCTVGGHPAAIGYDRLVFALGSELVRPPVPSLDEHGFDIDTYEAASKLDAHLRALPSRPAASGRFTALVIGGGLTGIEMATELGTRMRDLAGGAPSRVVIIDRAPRIGAMMGEQACAVIDEALRELRIEIRAGVSVVSADAQGVRLSSGEDIAAATIIWCGGLRAHGLAATLPGKHDATGRLAVDRFLKVEGIADVYAAGDVAAAQLDASHISVMSCQHARPMGRIAGHNVVCDLVGEAPIPLEIGYYVTCLDLGAWGAVYCQGWDRAVAAKGASAKATKRMINRERIYPPRSRDPREIFAVAAPVTQAPPQQFAAK